MAAGRGQCARSGQDVTFVFEDLRGAHYAGHGELGGWGKGVPNQPAAVGRRHITQRPGNYFKKCSLGGGKMKKYTLREKKTLLDISVNKGCCSH